MTETRDGAQASSDRAGKPAIEARTLLEFVAAKDGKAAAFVDAVEKGEIPRPSDAERDAATEYVLGNPAALARVAELSRAAADSKVSSVSQIVLQWAAGVLRESDPRFAEWMALGGATPEIQLRQLSDAVARAADKGEKLIAEARLSIGMAVLTRQFNLDPIEALRAIAYSLGARDRSPAAQAKDKRLAAKLVRRASGKQLESLSLIARLFDISLSEARLRQSNAEADKQEADDRYSATRVQLERREAEVRELTAELADYKHRVEGLSNDIRGLKGDAAHGEIELKARQRQLLRSRLTPFLKDAREVLENEPPLPDVALERVRLVQTEIERELQWLDKSSD